MKIKKGNQYLCIKEVIMTDGETAYIKGKTYPCEEDKCVTDEQGFTRHGWNPKELNEYFELVKTYTITKDQVQSLHRHGNSITKAFCMETYPDCFPCFLQVNKWYKRRPIGQDSDILFCFQGVYGDVKGNYGFSTKGVFFNDLCVYQDSECFEATNQEVTYALIAECDKLGFKNGVYFNQIGSEKLGRIDLEFKTEYKADRNEFWRGGYCLFKDGIFATIIKPKQMSQSDIEKELGYKIEIV